MADLETPFPYQVTGAQFLASNAQALLADEMGLGKSAQVVIACDAVGASHILVVCPAAVRINWSREFQRFSPMDHQCTVVATGYDRASPAGVSIVSYDLLAANEKVRQGIRAMDWDVVVIDEAHYLKERSAKRTRALYGHAGKNGIIHSSKRVWRLTGTPAPNDASELFTHLKSAGVEKRSYWDFVYDFCEGFDSSYGFKITGHKNTDKLKALMAQFMLRRKKEDVMKELPPIGYTHVTVERSQVQLDPYFYENWRAVGATQFMRDMEQMDKATKIALRAVEVGSEVRVADRLKLLEAMAKSTATLRRYIGLAKLPRVLEIIEQELIENPKLKIVLFAIHKDVIECSREKLRKYGAVTLYGNTPAEKRQTHIDRFQTDPKCRVFIGNIQAAGTGITLTASNEVAFIEADWVPANNAQAAMRCHRIGQTRPVRVRFFSCAGSVDEDVMKTLIHKTRELSKIFD
ncbi:HepA Superfamily II DNA/RNA helicases, SNF2 family [uncultured Caudovirales phage]|uniref:HepA Superfamily II DNA/RNA helicases, SNF2 family n=1 Tax=uncultured Caudovirales phage TaxID=2100421 RepID=A0A6J7W5I1_9CAUD|nr:HepA Superfamily II DNA/RNA helicases, SNF2 family [uncultured Caudovirales phage]